MTNPTTKSAKSTKGKSSKVISTGLAVATGIGVVGLIGVRTSEEASANNASVDSSASVSDSGVVVSSAGYTKEQLDAYAVALAQEAARLQAYRDQLVQVAGGNSADAGAIQLAAAPKPKKQKLVSKPAPAVKAPKAQSNSQGS